MLNKAGLSTVNFSSSGTTVLDVNDANSNRPTAGDTGTSKPVNHNTDTTGPTGACGNDKSCHTASIKVCHCITVYNSVYHSLLQHPEERPSSSVELIDDDDWFAVLDDEQLMFLDNI